VDDLITTGGTICAASRLLAQSGAREICVAVTHAVFIPEAAENLSKAPISEYIVTDSVPMRLPSDKLPVHVLSVANLFAEAIERIHNSQSVSSLFDIQR
jgi:ribose-phosphate pyrophosphokinase